MENPQYAAPDLLVSRETPKKYRYKPIHVEAVKWDGSAEHAQELLRWTMAHGTEGKYHPPGEDGEDAHIYLYTEGLDPVVFATDYLVLESDGEFTTRSAGFFESAYEERR